MTRILSVGIAAAAFAAVVPAQLDGPAPLAWRWAQSTTVAPSGSPLVDGNVVYVAVGQRVYALDKDTGNQRWKFPAVEPIDGFFRTEPIKVGGLIIIAGDNKTIYALDPESGEKKWQYDSAIPIIGQPVALGDSRIGFAMSDNTLMEIGTNGQAIWAGPQKIFDGIVGRISSYQDNILVMTQVNDLQAIDTTGKLAWKRNFSGLGADAKPVVFGDNIYINTNSFVVALSGAGTFKWSSDAGDMITYPVSVSPEGIAVGTRDGRVVVFDPNSGRKVSFQVTDPTTNKIVSADSVDLGSFPLGPAGAVGHEFLYQTTAGTVTMFDPHSGKMLWNYTIKPMVKAAKQDTQAGGNFPGAPGGGGRPGGGPGAGGPGGNSSQTTPDPTSVQAAGPPVVAGNTILVLAKDGSLLAFDRSSGVDVTPPDVAMTFPNPGDQVTSKGLEVHFQLDDESSGLKTDSVAITVDGKPLESKLTRDGDLSVRFSLAAKNGLLSDGRHVFSITASDWMGNSSTSTFSLTIDNNLQPLGAPKTNGTGGPNGGRGPGGPGGGGSGGD